MANKQFSAFFQMDPFEKLNTSTDSTVSIIKEGLKKNIKIWAGSPEQVTLKKSEVINDRKLVLISDVSCDPGSDFNTIPLYDKPSSFEKPFQYIIDEKKPLILTAIDNLPAMLPKESSLDFENQLLPYLFDFNMDKTGVWSGAEEIFYNNLNQIQK